MVMEPGAHYSSFMLENNVHNTLITNLNGGRKCRWIIIYDLVLDLLEHTNMEESRIWNYFWDPSLNLFGEITPLFEMVESCTFYRKIWFQPSPIFRCPWKRHYICKRKINTSVNSKPSLLSNPARIWIKLGLGRIAGSTFDWRRKKIKKWMDTNFNQFLSSLHIFLFLHLTYIDIYLTTPHQ